MMVKKALLVCGVLSTVLYIGADVVAAAALYPGYSYTAQQVSELSAIGAPTRAFWVSMARVYAPLVVAFGVGVWMSAGRKWPLKVSASLMIAFAVIGQLWPPMHQRGAVGSTTDTLHLVFAGVEVLLMVLFIAFGSGARAGGFRTYSVVTIVAMLAAGGLVSALAAPAIAAGQPTPGMGLVERVSVYAPLIWVMALSVVLLLPRPGTAAD